MPTITPEIRAALEAEARRRGIRLPDTSRIVPACPEWAHEGQRAWYLSNQPTTIGLAGAQGGKTAMLPHLLLRRMVEAREVVQRVGRADALYIGPTLELLSAQAIPTFRRLWEEELRLGRMIMGGKPRFEISPAGSRRMFGFEVPGTVRCAYANDSSNLESLTAIAAAWDEAGQKDNKEESYQAVLRRLTVARSMGHGHLDMGTTPYEWGWLKQLVDTLPVEAVYNWPSWANPLVDRDEIESRKAGMPLWRWEMMYLGKYTRPAGVVYDCWSDENVCEPFQIPKEWPLYMGVDFGLINTAAVVIAEELGKDWRGNWAAPTGRYYVVATYHAGASGTASEHLRAIREAVDKIVVGGRSQKPTAYGGSHQESGWRESYALSGVGIMEPPVLKVESQIAALYAGFKARKVIERDGKPDPVLRIFSNLTNLRREIEEFSYELDEAGEPTEKLKDEAKYHRLAAFRYVASKLFKGVERRGKPALAMGLRS